MSLNFYQGTTTTHTTLQVSQNLFDLEVTEISARNENAIQSLFRNDLSGYLTYFEPGSPVVSVVSKLFSLVWLFAINRTTIPRIYSCSELACAIVDLGIVGLSVMCAHFGHNLFIYLCKT